MENNHTDKQFHAYMKICRAVAYILTIIFAIVSTVTILVYDNIDMKGVKGKVIKRTDTHIIAQTEYGKVTLKENTACYWVIINGDEVIFRRSVALHQVVTGYEHCLLTIMCLVSIIIIAICAIPQLWFNWIKGKPVSDALRYPTEV